MILHTIKAGEGDAFVSEGVEKVSQFATGKSDGAARHEAPGLAGGHGADTMCGRRTGHGHGPRATELRSL